MKKIISIILSLALCSFLFPNCLASNTDQFIFRDGITWGMTVEEVKYHEKSQNYEYLDSDESSYSLLGYADVEVSSYPSATLLYLFKNGALFGSAYDFTGATRDTLKYLNNALHAKYGESHSLGASDIVQFFKYTYGLMYFAEEEDIFESMYEDAGVDNFDDFIDALVDVLGYLSPEDLSGLSELGEAWHFSDGTLLIITDTKEYNDTMILYCAPEVDYYITNGL